MEWSTITKFEDVWKLLDPESSGLIPRWKLKPLCDLLVQGEFVDGRLEGGVTVCLSDCVCVSLSVTDARPHGLARHDAGEVVEGRREPLLLGLPLTKEEDEGGISHAVLYRELQVRSRVKPSTGK